MQQFCVVPRKEPGPIPILVLVILYNGFSQPVREMIKLFT